MQTPALTGTIQPAETTKAPEPPVVTTASAFFHTLAGSNKGRRLTLDGPDGKPTTAWIDVRGIDSEVFQLANNTQRRAMVEYLEQHGDTPKIRETPEFVAWVAEQQRKLRASLVIAWSFEEPCTEANVLELFKNAPDVAQQVDIFASKRGQFAGA